MRYGDIANYNLTQYDQNQAAIEGCMPSWINKVKEKMPYGFSMSDAEIESEIRCACAYLSDKFRGGRFILYCWRYAPLKTLNAIYEDYFKMKMSDSIEVRDPAVEWKMDSVALEQYREKELEKDGQEARRELVELIRHKAQGIDREIVERIIEGETIIKISKDIGLSRPTIYKRLKALRP